MPRGRPRTTNPDEVLDNVLKMFWKQGYAGTSLNDLVAASGMAKPGLYANFGDKETLYAKALDLYANRIAEPMLAEVGDEELHIRTAIGGYLERIASTALNPDGPKGCLIALSLIDIQSLPGSLREIAKARNAQRGKAILDRLKIAASRGQIGPEESVTDLASYFSAQALAVTSLARAGEEFDDILTVISQSLRLLPDP